MGAMSPAGADFAVFLAAVLRTAVFFAALGSSVGGASTGSLAAGLTAVAFLTARLRAAGAGDGRSFCGLVLIRSLGKYDGWISRARGSGVELIEDFVRDLKVGEDIHSVGVIVELVVELEDLAGDGRIIDDRGGL